MTRRQKIIIGILLAVLLVLLAIALYLWLQQRKTAVPTIDVTANGKPAATTTLPDTGSPNRTSGATATTPEPVTPAPAVKVDDTSSVKRFAAAFAERFGSFSNQTDFVNITDLRGSMTPSMQAWADKFVADARAAGADTTIYSGTTTRALTTTVTAFDEKAGTATVRVGTQRQQVASGTTAGEVYYQDIIIKVIKSDGEWKVDFAQWQKRP